MNKINPAFISAEWQSMLPPEDQKGRAQHLRDGREGRGPQHFRFGNSQRSEPYYKKSDVLAWFRVWYSVLRPDLVKQLEDMGWDDYRVPEPREFPRPKRRGRKPPAKRAVTLKQQRHSPLASGKAAARLKRNASDAV